MTKFLMNGLIKYIEIVLRYNMAKLIDYALKFGIKDVRALQLKLDDILYLNTFNVDVYIKAFQNRENAIVLSINIPLYYRWQVALLADIRNAVQGAGF